MNKEFLSEFANQFVNKDFDYLDKTINTKKIELVNTNEVINKNEYIDLLKERLTNSFVKIDRCSFYQNDKDNGLVIYHIKNDNKNYKLVAFYIIDNETIIDIQDYWFVVF